MKNKFKIAAKEQSKIYKSNNALLIYRTKKEYENWGKNTKWRKHFNGKIRFERSKNTTEDGIKIAK